MLRRRKLEHKAIGLRPQEMKHDEGIKRDFADESAHCSVLANGEATGR